MVAWSSEDKKMSPSSFGVDNRKVSVSEAYKIGSPFRVNLHKGTASLIFSLLF